MIGIDMSEGSRRVRLTAPQEEQVFAVEAVAAPHLGQALVWALVMGCMFAVIWLCDVLLVRFLCVLYE